MRDQKIILLEHRPDYKAIYGLNLTVYIGVKVLIAATVREVVTHLENNDCSLIFVNNDSYVVDVGQEVYNYLSKINSKIPFYILGKSSAPQDMATVYDSSMKLKYILQNVAKTLGVTAEMMANKCLNDYFPMPVEFLLPGWKCSHDLYINEGGEYKILFIEDDIILYDEISKLEVKGTEYLYISSLDRLKFTNSLTHQLVAKLNDPNITAEERMEITAQGYQMVQEQARKIGIAESTMETARECIKSMTIITESHPAIESLLGNLMQQDGSYLYRHSLLISFIGTHIIKKMAWGNKEQQDKFTFVSFFHDLVLTRDELAKFRTDSELHQSNLSDKDKQIVLDHAINSAKLVSKIKNFPFGADTIIKQHHGSKSGKGLSRTSVGLSPLAIVFVIAEEWADLVLKHEDIAERPDKKSIITKLHYKYKAKGFHKVLPILDTLEI